MRILVVDDYAPFRSSVARFLRHHHHVDVVEAEDGIEALERLREGVFDAILLDLEMPRMDGVELFERLSADAASKTFLMTAGGRKEQEAWLTGFDADRVLRKPIDLERLTAVVTAAAARAPAAKPNSA